MIDFRSDTVTKPSDAMRKVMAAAAVGDDVYGEDPTVIELQEYAKDFTGAKAALYCSSGTQANLLAIMAHCQRGDEYICGQQAHNYKYEGGGAAVLGSIQPQPLENNADATIDLAKVKAAIKADDVHFAQTRLLSLENTMGGKVLPYEYLLEARAFVDQHNLALHLDGARLFNAAVKQQRSLAELSQPFDSFTLCLSKGLGAPVGSLLLGEPDYIQRALRIRKMLGGGMRQAGIIAAGGLYALQHNIERLAEDHANAELLAQGLSEITELDSDPTLVQTNIVYARCRQGNSHALAAYLKTQGFAITAGEPMRFVTHLNVTQSDVRQLLEAIKRFYQS